MTNALLTFVRLLFMRTPIFTGRLFFVLPVLLLVTACTTLKVPVPEGFAVVEKPAWSGGEFFSALSPEGIRYRVRTVENYPEMDLAFWKDALELHLKKEGYQSVGEPVTFTSAGKEGEIFEWGVPYGEENHVFLTAIIVYPKKILIAEAGGEISIYGSYREPLLASIRNIELK